MRNPKNLKFAVGIAVAVVSIAVCCVALAADLSGDSKPAAVDSTQYADFMANEALDIQDLAEGAEIQRRMFNRITPPGFSLIQPMFPALVPFDATNFDEKFLGELLGEDKNSVAIYPLSLALDPKTRETLVYNAEGKLIASIPADKTSCYWPKDSDPARVILQLDMLPSEDVEQYLYTESRISIYEETRTAKAKKTSGVALRSLSASEFGICNFQRQTNGTLRLTVTNGADVAELFSYTVWHTSAVVAATWTNEESNVVTDTNTLWYPVSPSFNGLESAWECRTTNLLLTNGVGVWDDANISSNARVRFYGVANRIDTDDDGLTDGAEKFVYHTNPDEPDTDGDELGDYEEVMTYETNPLNPDTDGDGLSDGWETQNNLNPNSSVGTDGADGDPDGDGLKNAEEQDLDTDPHGANQVNLLGSTDAAVEYKSIESQRNKYGFSEYTNASVPPRYYLTENGTYYWLTTQPQQEPPRETSATLSHLVDTNTGEVSGGWTGYDKQAASDDQCHTTYFTNRAASSYRGGTLTQTHSYQLVDEDDYPYTYLDCSGYHDGQAHRYLSCTIDLENEYTTDLLLSLTSSDLYNYGNLANIGWGEGRKWVPTGYVSCAATTAALRDMRANEFNTNDIEYKLSMAKIGYRFKTVNLQTGQVFRLNWAERFTPEGGGADSVLRTLTAVMKGAGGTQYIENASYVIDPPETDGSIAPSFYHVAVTPGNRTGCPHCMPSIYFSLTNSFVPNGVTWTISPSNLSGGATITPSGNQATVDTGTLGTNYTIRATSVDSTNCYGEATFTLYMPGSITQTSNSYVDTSTESRKNIRHAFSPTPTGTAAADHFCFVQRVKGFFRRADGSYFSVTMYGNTVPMNFADWVIDSLDDDPSYGSPPHNAHSSAGGNVYYVSDSPGPALSSEIGCVYNVDFTIGIYCTNEVPTSGCAAQPSTGTSFATATWDYKTTVTTNGTFTHP